MPAPDSSNSLQVTTAQQWRTWLRKHHQRASEVWLVSYKKATGKPAVGYENALEEAICFGWIDTLVRRIDGQRYATRWMPRRPGGTWSEANLTLAKRLIDQGRMTEAGLAALGPDAANPKRADPLKTVPQLDPGIEEEFRKNKKVWSFFQSLAPGYRKRYLGWIGDARREETRRKRIIEAKRQLARGVKSLMK